MFRFVKYSSYLLLAIVFTLFLHVFFVQAQAEALQIDVIPQNPGPYQTVNINIEDYSRDLNKLEVLWSVNGKVEASGVGLKNFQVKTGAVGTATKVTINMGGELQTVILRPSVTDLIWQSDTYTPPFYAGRALHSSQDPIIVLAEPFIVKTDGTRLDPNDLVYKWSIDGTVNGGASGTGKQSFKITPSILEKPITVTADITSLDHTYNSSASIVIPTSQPEVVLYQNHPLYGVDFNNSLNNKEFPVSNSEANIIAEPFYFSNTQKNFNSLTYNWNLNNLGTGQQGNEIVLRKPEGGGTGKSLISVSVKNLQRFIQNAEAQMYASFGTTNNQSTNVF